MNHLEKAINKISPDEKMKERIQNCVLNGRRKKTFRFAVLISACTACILFFACLFPILQKNKGVSFDTSVEGAGGIQADGFTDSQEFVIYHGQYYRMGACYRTSLSVKENINNFIPYNDNAKFLIGDKLGTTALNELDINQEGIFIQDAENYSNFTSNVSGTEIYSVKGKNPEDVLLAIDSWGIIRFFLRVQ